MQLAGRRGTVDKHRQIDSGLWVESQRGRVPCCHARSATEPATLNSAVRRATERESGYSHCSRTALDKTVPECDAGEDRTLS